MKKCVACETELTGSQRLYCSERCKQAVKYAVSQGRMCKVCYKKMKPTPVLGGFKQTCDRKRCGSNK